MSIKYINISNRVDDNNVIDLPNDFTQSGNVQAGASNNEKFISVLKVRLINNNEEVKIYNDVSKLDKWRTNLLKDNYKVINKNGNVYKLQNAKNIDEIIFKPRFQIKKSNTFKSSKLYVYDDIMKFFKLINAH